MLAVHACYFIFLSTMLMHFSPSHCSALSANQPWRHHALWLDYRPDIPQHDPDARADPCAVRAQQDTCNPRDHVSQQLLGFFVNELRWQLQHCDFGLESGEITGFLCHIGHRRSWSVLLKLVPYRRSGNSSSMVGVSWWFSVWAWSWAMCRAHTPFVLTRGLQLLDVVPFYHRTVCRM